MFCRMQEECRDWTPPDAPHRVLGETSDIIILVFYFPDYRMDNASRTPPAMYLMKQVILLVFMAKQLPMVNLYLVKNITQRLNLQL